MKGRLATTLSGTGASWVLALLAAALASLAASPALAQSLPRLSFDDNFPSVTEGGVGDSTTLEFVVVMSKTSTRTVTATLTENTGSSTTADSGADFEGFGTATATFAPGTTRYTLSVTVYGDALDEEDEDIVVFLTNPQNATIGGSSLIAYGTIVDDDI